MVSILVCTSFIKICLSVLSSSEGGCNFKTQVLSRIGDVVILWPSIVLLAEENVPLYFIGISTSSSQQITAYSSNSMLVFGESSKPCVWWEKILSWEKLSYLAKEI